MEDRMPDTEVSFYHFPIKVSFRHVTPSDVVADSVRERARRLCRVSSHIMRCDVMVEASSRRAKKGWLYHVRVRVTVPGGDVVVGRDPAKAAAHEDVLVAVRDAFDATRRRLRNQTRRRGRQTPRRPLSAVA